MTPAQWADICDEVESLFGRSGKWTPKITKRVFQKFAHRTPHVAAMSVVQDAFLASTEHAPSPSTIISAALSRGGSEATIRGACKHAHFAIFAYHEDGTGKEGVCAVCRTGYSWKPGAGPRTVGDIEHLASERSEVQDVMA